MAVFLWYSWYREPKNEEQEFVLYTEDEYKKIKK